MTDTITLIKTIRSHTKLAQYLASLETDSDGDVLVVREILSGRLPLCRYSYSPERSVYRTIDGREIVVLEIGHRFYQIFDVTDCS